MKKCGKVWEKSWQKVGKKLAKSWQKVDKKLAKSSRVEAEATFKKSIQTNTVQEHIPQFTGERAVALRNQFDTNVKDTVKANLAVERRKKWEDHVKDLVVQGKFLALAAAENEDIVWKSAMYDLKQGTLKFLLNASIDTLPTAANFERWKKLSCDLCKLCKRRQTTEHILNNCKVALDTNRYTWRHNCVINYIVTNVNSQFRVFSDLQGHTAAGGGSIPPELCVTTLKPDIVILDDKAKTIHMFELTCPSEHNIEQRHTEKSNKYAHFTTDISEYKCKVDAFEVSSKGFLTSRNHTTLATLHKYINPHIKLQTFKKNISALSLTASYHIFN